MLSQKGGDGLSELKTTKNQENQEQTQAREKYP
jgi:hypothetical protein